MSQYKIQVEMKFTDRNNEWKCNTCFRLGIKSKTGVQEIYKFGLVWLPIIFPARFSFDQPLKGAMQAASPNRKLQNTNITASLAMQSLA